MPSPAVVTAGELVREGSSRLRAAGCDTPRLDAEVLVSHALGVERAVLLAHPELPLEPEAAARADEALRRREAREPVAYVTGRRAFRFIEIEVDRRVLVPRPETELLVEEALGLPAAARVHDLGTGSGAVALALAHERPDLDVTASDVDAGAVAVARANAARLGLDVPVLLLDGLPPGGCDLVLANLPYVPEAAWERLEPEVREWEPSSALVAGRDGLAAIRGFLARAPAGTRVALEHGAEQGAAVRALLRAARTRRDLAGHERVTVGRVP
jgi:release factor glutamine methyltransferase